MRLSGLTLETVHFEDYLSFLSEVLELELIELTDISMKLDLSPTWLEIKKVPTAPQQVATNIEFSLEESEYESLAQKISFYHYRKGSLGFSFLEEASDYIAVTDPDGRLWRFRKYLKAQAFHSNSLSM